MIARCIAFTIILAVGALIRFSDLADPAIWKDEAYTYWRVTGSYRQMLEILRYDGFMPLHYEAYFALSRYIELSPQMMRLIPAVAGTLTVAAVYFVARMMFTPRVALLAMSMAATARS